MNPHPYFRDQIAADRRQALTEQADAHRRLNPRGAPSKRMRGLALRQRLARRPRQLQVIRADAPSTAPNPVPPVIAPDTALPLPTADR
jgi:hypothetical protein